MLLDKYRQIGSATKFIIIAVVLVIITVSVIAIVAKRGESARRDQLIAQTNQQLAAQKAAKDAQNNSKNAPASNTAGTTNDSGAPTSTQTGNKALPTTGPELDVIRIVAVGLLAGTATSFVISRRGLRRSL